MRKKVSIIHFFEMRMELSVMKTNNRYKKNLTDFKN